MRRLISISLWALALLVGTCFTACTFHEDMDMSVCQEETEFYLKLNISFINEDKVTRAATPIGDEDGDGRENAHYHENDINDLCFFIYNDGGKLFNAAAASTPIKYKKYVDGLTFTGNDNYETDPIPIKGYVPAAGDRVIVITNVGDKTSAYNTLDDIRNAKITREESWTSASNIADYTSFAMTSARDEVSTGKVDISYNGTQEHPFLGSVIIERVAARVDWVLPLISVGNPDLSDKGAKYTIDATGEGTEGTVYVQNIRMVNESQKPTYLIRRTSPTVNPLGTVTYMGLVDKDANNHPTSYVVEPLTTNKHTSAPEASTLTSWFGESSFASSKSATFCDGTDYSVWNNANGKTFTVETSKTCYTIGYAMENTMDVSLQTNDVRTGVELKCVFVPEKVYSTGETYTPGTYSTTTTYYYLEDLDDRTKSRFFDTSAHRDDYKTAHPGHYKEHTYTNGYCYYYIWLKYAGCESVAEEGTYGMEYAIVRNNIYRIEIDKVLSVGTPTPDPKAIERIRVRQWNKRTHAEILL